jgi:drug/metabolite transporter (DMT)-like permease
VVGIVLVLVGATLVARLGRTERASIKPVERKRLVLGVSLAVLIAVLWAASAVMLSIGLRSTPPLVVSSIRLAVVVIGSLGAVAARGKLHEVTAFRGALLGRLALSSLLGSIGSATLFILAIALIGPSRVTAINAAVPLFGAIMGYVFLHERLSSQIWVGTLLTVVGLVLVVL